MARIARLVVPGVAHHVTQRGNRRQAVFLADDDYAAYRALLAESCRRADVEIRSYCLMPNHVHLVAVPHVAAGLSAALGEAHRRYAADINRRHGWRGHLWQDRFASFPMDDAYLHAAIRYVELNPVRAGLAEYAWDYRWSSARAYVDGAADPLVRTDALTAMIGDGAAWRRFLAAPPDADGDGDEHQRRHARTGRPLGPAAFVKNLEAETGRALAPRKRGPKAGAEADTQTLKLDI